MPKELKPIPKFASEDEERRFWETHDSFDYVDWDNAVRVRLPNLRFSQETRQERATPTGEKAVD